MADEVSDGFAASALPARFKTALEFTDHMLVRPGPLDQPLRDQVTAAFDPGELVELALGLGLFHGFSKMLIALGLEPEEMDTTVVPTPAPLSRDAAPGGLDPRADVLAPRPDLRARWEHMASELAAMDALPATAVQAIDRRAAALLGAPWGTTGGEVSVDDELHALVTELTELFLIDVRAIEPARVDALRAAVGDAGVVQAVMTMAVSDGIARVGVTLGD